VEPKELKTLARRAQSLASGFAPLQNDKGISLPSRLWLRGVDQIRHFLFGYRNKELSPRFVAEVTNALLSCGNVLESIADGKIVVKPEEVKESVN